MVSAAAKNIFIQAVAANSMGDHYPIWGTCLGFEWLIQLAAGDLDTGFDSENISLPLKFVGPSRMFTPDMVNSAQGNVTMNNHGSGITPPHFTQSSQLTSIYNLVATSTDRKGKEFVSVFEGKTMPIYGTQFHPEKNAFEWAQLPNGQFYEAINHGATAVGLSAKLADFFVNEARQNTHRFSSPSAEQAALIWNFPVSHTGPGTDWEKSPFTEMYFFKF